MLIPTLVRREVLGAEESQLLQGNAALPEAIPESFLGTARCVYLDPPFMTGKVFPRSRPYGTRGWKTGSPALKLKSYDDRFPSSEDYLTFLRGLLENSRRVLREDGVLLLHLDWRSSARGRLLCDELFGEKNFLNEIIWSYESGGTATTHYARKHDTILMYAVGEDYRFDITRIPIGTRQMKDNHMKRSVDENGRAYRAIRSGGKEYRYYEDEPVYPGDVWTDISILQQRDPERMGFRTQKPMRLLERLLKPLVQPGDLVADLCCGSGTTLAAAQSLGCRFLGMDISAEALAVSASRLESGYVLDFSPAEDPARPEGAPEAGGFALRGYSSDFPFPASNDPVAAVEQWRIGRIRNDIFYATESAARSFLQPELMCWLPLPDGEGDLGISITDAAGQRRVFRWEEA